MATVATREDIMTDHAYDYAQTLKESLAEMWDVIDGEASRPCKNPDHYLVGRCGEACDECDGTGIIAVTGIEGEEPTDYLNNLPLEIVWEVGEPFAVVLACGGPHAEIVGGGRNGGFQLVVTFGRDKSTVTSDAITRTGEYFRELVSGE